MMDFFTTAPYIAPQHEALSKRRDRNFAQATTGPRLD
jgi:hypothetical protein